MSVPDEARAAGPLGAAAVGTVYLVGAGPGDPRQLTLEAYDRIRSAQVIVHDALVPEGIRALFPPGAILLDGGKRAGCAGSVPQQTITGWLIHHARNGADVVRLKGGDPFVFGRGGEEVDDLRRAGIPVRILPGVTAAQAAAAELGTALTHRAWSRSCVLLNGHRPNLHRLDWAGLVALGGTWVFYMASRAAQEIAQRLLAHGAEPGCVLLLVENASRPEFAWQQASLAQAAAAPLTPLGSGPGLVLVLPPGAAEAIDNSSWRTVDGFSAFISDLAEPCGAPGADRGRGKSGLAEGGIAAAGAGPGDGGRS